MFDVSGWELLIVALIALVVVGPKDLPRLMHGLGRLAARGRQSLQAFSRMLTEIEKESDHDRR